jgi:glucose-1-phosphate thymidylyltransferase
MEKIGLVPAAGYARRLGTLNSSKEMIIVDGEYGKEPICRSLLRQFEYAGISNIVVVTRPDKTDLVDYFANGLDHKFEISMVYLEDTKSTLATICAAYKYIKNKTVYLGFPDILLSPVDAVKRITESSRFTKSDVILGAFRSHNPEKVDMVDFDDDGKLQNIEIKNHNCRYEFAWIFAIWQPQFSKYLMDHIDALDSDIDREVYLGDLLSYYLSEGNEIYIHTIEDGDFTDIGTPEDLENLL